MAKHIDLSNIIEQLEDQNFNSSTRSRDYLNIKSDFDTEGPIIVTNIHKLMHIIHKDLRKMDGSIASVICALQSIVEKVKKGECSPTPVLLPSAIIILDQLESIATMNNVDSIKQLMYTTLLLYPDDIFLEMHTTHSNAVRQLVLTLTYAYQKHGLIQNRELPLKVFMKLLKLLPLDEKQKLVKDHIDLWFQKVIPMTMGMLMSDAPCSLMYTNAYIDVVEMLTDILIQFDYANNRSWHVLLECIYNARKYPTILKNLLEKGCNSWHRLWKVFIKLLKDQITKVSITSCSPINALLPVVELAFKMDPGNRCRAFECWDELINNFSSETNENFIRKRLKLLMIPLISNNAKTDATAVAKLNTWWHLIRKFETHLHQFTEVILIPFLHICYGKHNSATSKLSSLVNFFLPVKKQCVAAFTEITGHVECTGCIDIPKLNNKVMTIKLLVDYWNDWLYSLSSAIKIASEVADDSMMQNVSCIWMSFLLTVSELPPNNVRKDLSNDIFKIIEQLLKDVPSNAKLAHIISNVLIKSLFANAKIKELLKTKDSPGPIHQILDTILDPTLTDFFLCKEPEEVVKLFKPITDFIVNEPNIPCSTFIIIWQTQDWQPNDHTLMLWTALVDSICASNLLTERAFNYGNLILWPIKNMCMFSSKRAEVAYYKWHTLYELIHMRQNQSSWMIIDSELLEILSAPREFVHSSAWFLLISALALVKQKFVHGNGSGCEIPLDIVIKVISNDNTITQFEKMFPIIMDIFVLILNKITHNNYVDAVNQVIVATKTLLNSINKLMRLQKETAIYKIPIENLIKEIEELLKMHDNNSFKDQLADPVRECLSIVDITPTLYASVTNVLATSVDISDENDLIPQTIKAVLSSEKQKNNEMEIQTNKESEKDDFAAPGAKVKKSKKKEPSIVTTVVDNGEEYVVVKSNWKFNPKKLTENQKEKFKRKREDIPALYQDLSQSQDEFKISAWKTDSQDTSTTSSKSASKSGNEEISIILKNLPSSEVVPKILENILSDSIKEVSDKKNENIAHNEKLMKSTKDPKAPRLALKDRVFRNVRNLMEKSGLHSESEAAPVEMNQTLNDNNKTPTMRSKSGVSVISSAPPKISSDRPSRVIKTPKKFENSEVFALKKRRRSDQDSQSTNSTPEPPDFLDEQLNNEYVSVKVKNTKENTNLHKTICTITKETQPKYEQTLSTMIIADKKVNEDESNIAEILETEQTIPKITNQEISEVTIDVDNNNMQREDAINADQNDVDNNDVGENKIDNCPIEDKQKTHTPKLGVKKNEDNQSTIKKKRSRIEKQLMIDMVEGHPLLQSRPLDPEQMSRIEKQLMIDMVEGHPLLQPRPLDHEQERLTRKKVSSPANGVHRKSLTEKMNKSKIDFKNDSKASKSDKKLKEKDTENSKLLKTSTIIVESQEKESISSDDFPNSEDIIESSQDSSVTTISVKSTKSNTKKTSSITKDKGIASAVQNTDTQKLIEYSNNEIISLNDTESSQVENEIIASPINSPTNKMAILNLHPPKNTVESKDAKDGKNLLNDFSNEIIHMDDSISYQQESHDDISLPRNKSLDIEKTELDLTENMDTLPIGSSEDKAESSDVIIINDVEKPTTISSTEDTIQISAETQEIAEADTQPMEIDSQNCSKQEHEKQRVSVDIQHVTSSISDTNEAPEINNSESSNACSPLKDATQKKKDFLNDTIELSPIKTLSPVREKKSPSPETSSDYVVIKLSSPVQSNGEPFSEKCDSPEVFTEDKVSPEKRDQSPPRTEVIVTNTSPSSSLSLIKNRPQMRSSGRAAQMLGLCALDKLQAIMNSDRSVDNDKPKKSSPLSTPARRNLRILYGTAGDNENQVNVNSNEENENFLKFKRTLPAANSSPANPILKRKLADISDEATITPANKRKRVSFHDPPVSTTVAVQKYIEPCGVRSPQSSILKRQDRPRGHSNMKSPKKLENVFKLDTVLTKAVESFSEDTTPVSEDTEMSSIDQTPAVEVVKTSELNDTDPICPNLLDCKDPIIEIAEELSSPAMKDLLIKELEGKIKTVSDLAKMTELEVNRLCIKAPKVKVAKKVLSDYAAKKLIDQIPKDSTDKEYTNDEVMIANTNVDISLASANNESMDVEVQTNELITIDTEMQTVPEPLTIKKMAYVQTEHISQSNANVQTIESGNKSTSAIIDSCLKERSDFVDELTKRLEETSVLQVADRLSVKSTMDLLTKKILQSETPVLSYLRDELSERFGSKELILFCTQLIQKVVDKPA